MRYRFIRTGDKPVDEGANEFEIRECFAYCTPKVKSRLDKFLKGKEDKMVFKFGGQTVEIRRDK